MHSLLFKERNDSIMPDFFRVLSKIQGRLLLSDRHPRRRRIGYTLPSPASSRD